MKVVGDGWEQLPMFEAPPRDKVVRSPRGASQTRCRGPKCLRMHSCRDPFGEFLPLCPECQTKATMRRFKESLR